VSVMADPCHDGPKKGNGPRHPCAAPWRALQADWAAASSVERTVYAVLLAGACALFAMGALLNIASADAKYMELPAHAAHGWTVTTTNNFARVDEHRFVAPAPPAQTIGSTLQSSSFGKQGSLPKCVFPTIKPEDLPTQLQDEYEVVKDMKQTPRGAVALFKNQPSESESAACVNNPLMQRLTARGTNYPMACLLAPDLILTSDPKPTMPTVRLPECTYKSPTKATVAMLKADPLWVISMKPAGTTLSEKSFQAVGFKPVVIPAVNGKEVTKDCDVGEWTPGVFGIRLSFRKLILRALNEGHERVIIAEDDVVLADDFSSKLQAALDTDRCGRFMFDDDTGGAVLLGSSDYGGAGMIKAGTNHGRAKCYNVNGLTYGAYATVYHRNVFLPILAWLDSPLFTSLPLDHIWKHLAVRGFAVRVLKPQLAVADILHASTTGLTSRTPVDKLDTSLTLWRSCLMHWDLATFVHYRMEFESRGLFGFNRRKYCFRTKFSQSSYRKTHNAVVMLRALPDTDDLSNLADMLISRWRAKMDGRYEGFIARPFIVIEAPPEMPDMDTDDLRAVVRGMRTQSFNAHQERVIQAVGLATSGADSQDVTEAVSEVVRKFVLDLYAPILVLSAVQTEELKRILFAEPIAQMYIDLHSEFLVPWVPTPAEMVQLLQATKPRGRHWYSLKVDPSDFSGVNDDNDAAGNQGDADYSAPAHALPSPEMTLTKLDVQHAASEALKLVHEYGHEVLAIAKRILGATGGGDNFRGYKSEASIVAEDTHNSVTAAEEITTYILTSSDEDDLEQSAEQVARVENLVKELLKAKKRVDQLRKHIHKNGGTLSDE
jgi:hypothetical protein